MHVQYMVTESDFGKQKNRSVRTLFDTLFSISP